MRCHYFFFSLLFSLLALILGHSLQAQVRAEQTPEALSLWLPGKTAPAIVFPLQEDWLAARMASSTIKGRLGSFRLKEHVRSHFRFEAIDSIVSIARGGLQIDGHLRERSRVCAFRLLAVAAGENELKLSIHTRSNLPMDRIILRYVQPSEAHLFGFGEQFSHLNMQGRRVTMIPEENGIGRGDPKITAFTRLAGVAGGDCSTYAPIPFYMSSGGKGICVTQGSPWYFDFGQHDRAEVYALEGSLEMTIWQYPQPLDMIEAFSRINGRFPLLPDWAFGTWLGIQGGTARVDSVLKVMQAADCNMAAVWIQDWVGRRATQYGNRLQWHWEADTAQYPDLKAWIAAKNAQQIKVLGYINPFLKAESKWVDTLAPYFAHDVHGVPICLPVGGFDAYQFELNDSATSQMMIDLIRKNMVDVGFSGWMADFAEWYPAGAYLRDPSGKKAPWIVRHNSYPIQWQSINRQAIATAPDSSDYVFFSRSGYLGAGQYATAYWAGDQMTSWGEDDGLPSAVKALISSGMSGIAINHSDIGGYTNVSNALLKINRDPILLQRWAEFAAFTPIFRTHEGLIPSQNAQAYDTLDGLAKSFATMSRVHAALRPYLKSLNVEAHEKGWPMVRHLWLHYPDDPEVLDLKYEYLLGRDILVIPNIAPPSPKNNRSSVHAYFPEGNWEHLLQPNILVTGRQWLEVDAPLGRPAVYIRADSPWKLQLQEDIAEAYR